MDREQAIERGNHAARLLSDSLYVESFDKVRQALLAKFESSPARDTEGRERLYMMLKALNDARAVLEQVMNDGKVAHHLVEQERRFKLKVFR
jgi:hypothetical protein